MAPPRGESGARLDTARGRAAEAAFQQRKAADVAQAAMRVAQSEAAHGRAAAAAAAVAAATAAAQRAAPVVQQAVAAHAQQIQSGSSSAPPVPQVQVPARSPVGDTGQGYVDEIVDLANAGDTSGFTKSDWQIIADNEGYETPRARAARLAAESGGDTDTDPGGDGANHLPRLQKPLLNVRNVYIMKVLNRIVKHLIGLTVKRHHLSFAVFSHNTAWVH